MIAKDIVKYTEEVYIKYGMGMKFDWDPKKSEATKADSSRGFDFNFATRAWDDPEAIEIPARSTTEPRTARLAKIDGKVYLVFFTMRGDTVRIISARRARPAEETKYGGG